MHIDIVSFFFARIVNAQCADSMTVSTNKVYSGYTDLYNNFKTCFLCLVWIAFERNVLYHYIKKSRSVAAIVFGHYQAINVDTSERHFLSHIVNAEQRIESSEPVEARRYWKSQKILCCCLKQHLIKFTAIAEAK